MYVAKTKTMPNGAVAEFHTIDTITITPNYTVAVINSRSTLDGPISWQESMTIPYEDIATDPLVSITTFLTRPEGYLEGGSSQSTPTELEALRASLLSRVVTVRDRKIASGAEFNGKKVDTDPVSIRNILGSYAAATASLIASVPFTINWRMNDNSLVPLDAISMIQMGNTVLKHVDFCYNRSWALKEEITNEDATVSDLNAILINEGWYDTIIETTPTPEPTTTD